MDTVPTELRNQFVRSLGRKLQEMEADLAALTKDPTRLEPLSSLLSNLHDLSGTGSMYGFPRVTDLGREGEQAGRRVLRDGVPAASLLAQWRGVLDGLRTELEASEQPGASQDSPQD